MTPAIETARLTSILRALLQQPPSENQDEHLLRSVASELGWPGCVLWERRDGGLAPTCVWADGISIPIDLPVTTSRLVDESWLTGRPVWWAETATGLNQLNRSDSAWPMFSFPILRGGEPTAVVEFYDTTAREADESHTAIAEALGSLLGDWRQRLALESERAVVIEQFGRSEARLRFLAETSRALSAAVEEKIIIEQLVDSLVPEACDACSVHLVTEHDSLVRAAAKATPTMTRQADQYITGGYFPAFTDDYGVGSVARTGLPVLYSQVSDALLESLAHDERHLEHLRSLGLRSAMVVPIIGQGTIIGVLAAVTAESGRTYTSDDLAFLEDLGRRAGLAIGSARLLERERTLALDLQSGLLPPRLPEPDWVDLAARYRPGQTNTLVGGDFYDSFWTPRGDLVVGVGDVCGHGPKAATMAQRIRYAARALARSHSSPARLLSTLSELIEDRDEPSFFTAIYALVEPRANGLKLVLARGGHPPPLIVRKSGDLEEIWSEGVVLGFYPNVDIQEVVVELGSDDLLLFYTDGVTELRRNGDMFGEDRLVEAVMGAPGNLPETTVESLMTALEQHNPEPVDDIVILALAARSRRE